MNTPEYISHETMIENLLIIAGYVHQTDDYDEGLRDAVTLLLDAIGDPRVTTAFHSIPKRTPWFTTKAVL